MLSIKNRYEILIATILFFLLVGIGKNVFMNKLLNIKQIVIITIAFFIFISLSKIMSNYIFSFYLDNIN